jgi:glycosyltransferase involved in cell wall biosynthesis
MPKLAILNTHPIQYFAPFYRRLSLEPDIELTVYFCSNQGAEDYFDGGFGERVKWDRPLLDGYNHHFLKNLRQRDRVGGFWSLINCEIINELRRNKYDALWVNGHNHATYMIGIWAARMLGIPVFMRCETHLSLRRSSIKRVIRKPLMRFFYNRLCDVCLPIGTRNREFYLDHGVSENRLFTVPYAVDNDYFTRAVESINDREKVRDELGLPSTKPLILFASKMLPRKRPMDLLSAYHRVRDSGTDAGLVFVGSGVQEELLRNYVREHQLSDVYFFGFRNQSELPKFYAAADVFVFPSEDEPWGLILNEAMCAALPVIVSKEIGAVPDLVHNGQNGFTFEARNVDQLTDCLHRLLEAPDMMKTMGARSREVINEWDYERCVRGIKNALAYIDPRLTRLAERQAA